MIQLNKLSFTFQRGSANETRAITDLNLNIKAGEFVVLLGANGSGKTTLLNLLAGTLFPDEGKILLNGKDVTRLPQHKRCRWITRLFQNPLVGTAPDLSILENFRLASLRTQKKGLHIGTGSVFRNLVKEQVSTLKLGLESKIDQAVGSLSGGQRQALTLLMGVMDEAKILLLDEPTAALDPKTSGVFMKLAEQVIRQRNLTTVLITHHLKEALEYGNRVIHLDNGQITHDIDGDKKSKLTRNDLFTWFGE